MHNIIAPTWCLLKQKLKHNVELFFAKMNFCPKKTILIKKGFFLNKKTFNIFLIKNYNVDAYIPWAHL